MGMERIWFEPYFASNGLDRVFSTLLIIVGSVKQVHDPCTSTNKMGIKGHVGYFLYCPSIFLSVCGRKVALKFLMTFAIMFMS